MKVGGISVGSVGTEHEEISTVGQTKWKSDL